MPTMTRYPVNGYKGVFYIEGTAIGSKRPERFYYIRYKNPAGKLVEEPVGRAGKPDRMTPATAAAIRTRRMKGEIPSNKEKREAERAAKAAPAERWTLSKLFEEYQEQHPGKKLANEKSRFKNYISPAFGAKMPEEIDPLSVDRLRMNLLKNLKPATVFAVLELFRRLVNFGVDRRLCGGLPFKLEMPTVNNIKTENLNAEQMARLLGILRDGTITDKDGKKTLLDPDAREMMLLALFTGMRRGEILGLKWADVDFQRGFITLREPKGGADQTIPLPDDARELLEDRPRRDGAAYVFPGRKLKGREEERPREGAARGFRAIREAAKLPKDFRPMHGLRHVFASTLASSGEVDLYIIQKLLTHKSPTMTQRYAHLRDETLKAASNVAGRLMRETTAERDTKKAEGTNE